MRDSVPGNVGTLVSFRVGPADAAVLAEEFAPEFSATDLMSLPNYRIYLRLMIDGAVSKSFSATTLAPVGHVGSERLPGTLGHPRRSLRLRPNI